MLGDSSTYTERVKYPLFNMTQKKLAMYRLKPLCGKKNALTP